MRYGTVLGFPVIVHPTWLVIFALLIVSLVSSVSIPDVARLPGAASLAVGALVVVLFIGSMLAHELAHAFVARGRGVTDARVRLLTPGGVESDARIEPARDEFAIAIVGPLLSVGIGAICLGLATVIPVAGEAETESTQALFYWTLLWTGLANLVLAGFHLIPAVPLDGGRVVRAVALSRTGDAASATRAAALLGRAVGIGMLGGGLLMIFATPQIFLGIWLVLLGWFTGRLAKGSVERQRLGELTAELTVGDLLEPDVPTVPASVTLATLLAQDERDPHSGGVYVAVDGDELLGVLETTPLRRSIWGRQGEQRIGDVAVPLEEVEGLAPSTPLMLAVDRFEMEGSDVLVVVDREGRATLAGVLRKSVVLDRLRDKQALSLSGLDR